MKRIAFATCDKLPELTADDRLVMPYLSERGLSLSPLIWNDETARLADYDCIVIRSCWDYHYQPQQFLQWLSQLEAQGIRLWNPKPVVTWNLNKLYLRELHERGAMIPPTLWFEPGAQADLRAILETQGWQRAVVKPLISATAYRTWVTTPETAPRQQGAFAELLADTGALVQRFVDEVQSEGEWSLIFLRGAFSHAVLKQAQAGDFRVQEEYGGTSLAATPPPFLIEQAQQILARVNEKLLFARVDGVQSDKQLCLMELELIEPHLFLGTDAHAPARFAAAIASEK